MANQFIWDGRTRIPWSKMVLPRKEGGLGVRDLFSIASAAPIKKTSVLWGRSPSWPMQSRYIKGRRALEDIRIKSSLDSAQWKELIAPKTNINICMECKAGHSVIWKIGGGKQNLIADAIRAKSTRIR